MSEIVSAQLDSAVGNRDSKSSSPTHSGVIVILTIEETILRS
jgi:hypothetical protein